MRRHTVIGLTLLVCLLALAGVLAFWEGDTSEQAEIVSGSDVAAGVEAPERSRSGGPQRSQDSGAPAATRAQRAEPSGATASARRDVIVPPRNGYAIVQVRDGRRVALQASPGGKVIREVGDTTEWGSPRVFGVQRVRGRWLGAPSPYVGNDELVWIRFDPAALRSLWTPISLVADLSEQRVTVRDEGRPIRSFPVTVGAPDTPTPVGRFAVTDTFRGDLNPSYGCCAVALTAKQPNLPSGWLGGNRIAIHGTQGAIGGAASAGCLRAAGDDLIALLESVPLGAPVRIRQ